MDLEPPPMITKPEKLDVYLFQLRNWAELDSRYNSTTKQMQFDIILAGIPLDNPYRARLTKEIGNSEQAKEKGIEVILNKLAEWCKEYYESKAYMTTNYMNFVKFMDKVRTNNQDLRMFILEWEILYDKMCKAEQMNMPDRLLAYKLMSACNLKDWTSTSVLEKARFGDKDGKVFERTRKAILYYHDISCTRAAWQNIIKNLAQ